MTNTIDEKTVGLLPKYEVARVSDPIGKHADCRYFVLDPTHDPLARAALAAYRDAAANAGYVPLADDLSAWLDQMGQR